MKHVQLLSDIGLVNSIINSYKNNISLECIQSQFNVSRNNIQFILNVNNIPKRVSIKNGSVIPQAVRDKISKSRSTWLRNNPDKHPWRTESRYISKPCELVKSMLTNANISFVAEYMPLSDRAFSVDIAFPDKKIGIEINGNQHYTKIGTLTKYYQARHDKIVAAGWSLYEYHYSLAYDVDLMSVIIDKLKTNYALGDIDYSFFIKRKSVVYCAQCGVEIHKNSKMCVKCNNVAKNKLSAKVGNRRPSYDQLLVDLSHMSMVKVGKKYSVSDNSIRKWLKAYRDEIG